MDINLALVVWLLTAHLIADFYAQTNWMAINKSKRLDALLLHVSCYSLIMAIATVSLSFGAVTFAAHFVTDFVTSRISRRQFPFLPLKRGRMIDMEGSLAAALWGFRLRRSRHNFFCTIGVDQWLHQIQSLLTAAWLLQ